MSRNYCSGKNNRNQERITSNGRCKTRRSKIRILTIYRSRPPTASAEFRALACSKPALFRPMLYSPAFTFSSVYQLVFLPCAGLRLGVLRQFQAFLASTACAACASSYHFSGIAPLPWRRAFSQFAPVVKLGFPVLASGSNCAVKPTRLRRAAYFGR